LTAVRHFFLSHYIDSIAFTNTTDVVSHGDDDYDDDDEWQLSNGIINCTDAVHSK